MIYVKTATGRQALKERSEVMPRKYHFPFLMFDGVRDSADILEAESAKGFTSADLEHMLKMDFIAPLAAPIIKPRQSPQNNAEQFSKLKKNASHYLEEILGPSAQELCMLLEECKTQEAFDARLEKTVIIVTQTASPAKAAAYRARVLAS